jgi:hypothetical protein
MNRAMVAMLFAAAFLGVEAASGAGPVNTASRTWDFSADLPGSPPAGFVFAKTGNGRPGRWVVISSAETGAKEKVLAQLDEDGTDYRFPIAVAQEVAARDLRLSVLCAPVSGRGDRACGIVFRYRDENNYYIARANALEDNIRLYRVKDGRREQFGTWDGKVSAGKWHELRADARGDRFEIYWDGKKVIDARDKTFSDAGKIGVWTKADSVTYFKSLKVEPLGP